MRKLVIGVVAVLCAGLVLVLVGEIDIRFTPADAQDQNGDEIPVGFQILLRTEGLEAFFTEVSGIGSESEIAEQKVVDKKGVQVVRKLPGRLKWQDISLKRGLMPDDLSLWDWRKSVEDGRVERKNGSIIMFGPDGGEFAQWDFKNAWPSKITGPQFKSDDNSFGVEELTLTHEYIERKH